MVLGESEQLLLVLLLVETMVKLVARLLSPPPGPDASLGCWGAASRRTNLGRVTNSSSLGWRRQSRRGCPAAISFLGTWSADKLARRRHQRPQDRRRGSSLGEKKKPRVESPELRAPSWSRPSPRRLSVRKRRENGRSFQGGCEEENVCVCV